MRVLDLYIQLRNFRAWSKVHRAKYVPRHMGDAFYAQTLALQKEASFAWWHRWAKRKRHLNKQWLLKGTRVHRQIESLLSPN